MRWLLNSLLRSHVPMVWLFARLVPNRIHPGGAPPQAVDNIAMGARRLRAGTLGEIVLAEKSSDRKCSCELYRYYRSPRIMAVREVPRR